MGGAIAVTCYASFMVAMLCPVDVQEELLSLPEAARELGMSHVSLWRLVRANRIPVVQVGTVTANKHVFGIRRDELEAFKRKDRPVGRPRTKRKPTP